MPTTQSTQSELPARFEDLVAEMPPRAIRDETQYNHTVEMIDRLMASGKLSKGQELYLETLVQLVEAYEARHHPFDTEHIGGLELLRDLLSQNQMSASDLGRLLGVHPSMGSKILKGQRSLTVAHVRRLAERFCLQPAAFLR